MKYLYVSTVPSPFQDEFVKECIKLSKSNNCFDYVYTLPLPSERKHWGDKKEYIEIEGNLYLGYWKLLKKRNPDFIILTQYKSLICFLSVIWCRINKKKYFIGPIEKLQPSNLIVKFIKKNIFKIVSRNACGIAGIGNSAVQEYQKLYSGVVLNIPYSFSLKHLLERERLKNSDVTFLYSGRLEEFRNPLFVLKCFKKIVSLNESCNLKLIMSGKGSLFEVCKKYIKDNDLENRVEWIIEFSDWYDIHNIYFKADVLLALQKYSGWGIIIQEAMAAGMGIISSNNMVASEDLIVADYNGYKVSVNNEYEVLKCMQSYIDNRNLVYIHGLRSREVVRTIDVSETSRKLIDFLENIKYE